MSVFSEALSGYVAQLQKARTEITGKVAELTARVTELEARDTITGDDLAALATIKEIAQSLDDIVPDAPAAVVEETHDNGDAAIAEELPEAPVDALTPVVEDVPAAEVPAEETPAVPAEETPAAPAEETPAAPATPAEEAPVAPVAPVENGDEAIVSPVNAEDAVVAPTE